MLALALVALAAASPVSLGATTGLGSWATSESRSVTRTPPKPTPRTISAAAPAAPTAQAPVVVRLATLAPAESPWGETVREFRNHLERGSDKRLRLKVVFLGGAGDEQEMVAGALRGEVDAIAVSASALAQHLPALQVLSLPYLFESQQEAEAILDGPLFEILSEELQKLGFVLHRYDDAGWFGFGTTFGQVTSPEALKGRRIRSLPAPVHVELMRYFGVEAVPLPLDQVLGALKDRRIEGFAQTSVLTVAFGWLPHVKYFTMTNHSYQPAFSLFRKDFFEALPVEFQRLVMSDRAEATARSRARVRALEREVRDMMQNSGVQVAELTASEHHGFSVFARNMRASYAATKLDATGRRIYRVINASKEELRSRLDPPARDH